jgi:hypothetical protein
MRAIVFRDDLGSATAAARLLRETRFRDSPLTLVSGLVLDNPVGGLNPFAVEHDLKLGGRVVWMPTLSAANHICRERVSSPGLPPTALTVLDARGRVTDDVREILDLIAEHDAVLASGRLHAAEVFPLFGEARARGVTRLLVSDPGRSGASPDDMGELATQGACLECAADLAGVIAAAGTGRAILSGAGRAGGLREAIRLCLAEGHSDEEVRSMVSLNPARLLGLAP